MDLVPDHQTIHHLDSLVAFYKTEQIWVLHTRASLSLASVTPQITKSQDNNPPLPEATPSNVSSKPLWARRRNNNKLKLANLSTQRSSRRLRFSESLLHMYGSLIDSRIESCNRMARIITRENNRRHLSATNIAPHTPLDHHQFTPLSSATLDFPFISPADSSPLSIS